MGTGNTDYSKQIDTALSQANQPKSSLSSQYSSLLGANAPNILQALMNVNSLGNSYLRPGAPSNARNGILGPGNLSGLNPISTYRPDQQGTARDPNIIGDAGKPVITNDINTGPVIPGTPSDPRMIGDAGGPNIINQLSGGPSMGASLGIDTGDMGGGPGGGPGTTIGTGGTIMVNPRPTNTGFDYRYNPSAIGQAGFDPGGMSIPGVSQANPDIINMLNSLGIPGLSDTISKLLPQGGFQPQQIQTPGNVSANFNPVSADLSKVPNSTTLAPQDSQYMSAITDILNQQLSHNVADTRERALNTGTASSTGESYDEATLKAQSLPQLAAALDNVRQSEVGNQLNQAGLQQSGILQNAGMLNQFGLGSAQLGANVGQNNILNLLNQQGMNQSAGIQGAGLNSNLLNTLLGTQTSQQGLGLQGANSLNSLMAQLGLGNAQASNQFNLSVAGLNQGAAQQQIQNQLASLSSLFGSGLGLASQGIPGGSANVSIGNSNPQGGGFGGTAAGIGSILSTIATLFA